MPGTREVQTLGGPGRVVRVLLDADRLASHGVTALDVRNALQLSNVTAPTGKLVRENREIVVETGNYLESAADVRSLVVGVQERSPVYLADVAEVVDGPDQPSRYVWTGAGPAAAREGHRARAGEHPAVTLQVTKKPGENAVDVAAPRDAARRRAQGHAHPGRRARDRHPQLRRHRQRQGAEPHQEAHLRHPVGRRARLRHARPARGARSSASRWCSRSPPRSSPRGPGASRSTASRSSRSSSPSASWWTTRSSWWRTSTATAASTGGPLCTASSPAAVDEVGGPTILATFTVIAALLPMAFVTGLMGPYMSPIPINASMGMLLSLAIAFTVTPWLALKLLATARRTRTPPPSTRSSSASSARSSGRFITAPRRRAQPPPAGHRHRRGHRALRGARGREAGDPQDAALRQQVRSSRWSWTCPRARPWR